MGRLEHLQGSLSAATRLLHVPIWKAEVGGPGPPLGRNLLRRVVVAPSGGEQDSDVSWSCSRLSFSLACKKRDRFLISSRPCLPSLHPLLLQQSNYRPLLPLSGPQLAPNQRKGPGERNREISVFGITSATSPMSSF